MSRIPNGSSEGGDIDLGRLIRDHKKSGTSIGGASGRSVLKSYGAFEVSIKHEIRIEMVSWSGQDRVLEIARFTKEGIYVKGMQFRKDSVVPLLNILKNVKIQDFESDKGRTK